MRRCVLGLLLGLVACATEERPPPSVTGGSGPTGGDATDAGSDTSETGEDTGSGDDDPNLVFVTSTAHLPGDIGGLVGADEICNERALEAGLTGNYVAWLSTSNVNGGDRLQQARGWVRPDGRPFVDTREDLFERLQAFPLRVDETGADVGSVLTATATRYFGAKNIDGDAGTCEDWTSSNAVLSHVSGRADAGARLWTDGLTISCDRAVHLYCFGVDRDVPLSVEPEQGRLAFVSLGAFDPTTGLNGADQLCQGEADAAGLEGQFTALLASSDQSAAARLDPSGSVWVRMDGVPILDAVADLATATDLVAPISFHVDETPVDNNLVWNGAESPGEPVNAETCLDWTSAASTGISSVAGRSAADWFGDGPRNCDDALLRVYCFEN